MFISQSTRFVSLEQFFHFLFKLVSFFVLFNVFHNKNKQNFFGAHEIATSEKVFTFDVYFKLINWAL
jgi:hypothetical protein